MYTFPPRFTLSSSFTMCDDVLLYTLEFLNQSEIANFGKVCRDFNRVSKIVYHLDYFFVHNPQMAIQAQRQIRLRSLVVNCVQDSQLFFTTLPEYVFLGHFSSLNSLTTFRGMFTGCTRESSYPKVKTLFIEEARVTVDWGIFPNLEELFIVTSQHDLNLDTLWKCQKLRKVIVNVQGNLIEIQNKAITKLPCLEILAISGGLLSGKFTTVSPYLRVCIFCSKPKEYIQGVYYKTHTDDREFQHLLRLHHKPPSNITKNVNKM